MKTLLKFLSIGLLVVLTTSVFAQDSWYGGQKLTGPWIDTQTDMPGESNEGKTPVPQSDQQTNIIPPQSQTDEYGYFNRNAYCTGFTGTQYIEVSNNPSFFNENFDGAIEMWIYPTSFASTGTTLMSLGSTSNKAFGWYVNNSGRFTFRIGTTEITNSSMTPIPLNTWTHVAVSWTHPSFYLVTFYVNGAQAGSVYNNTGTWNFTTSPLRIGRDQAFTTSAFRGSMDEVKFWEPSRTLAQIRDNRFVGLGDGTGANSGNALTSSSHYSGLKCSWNFNTGNNPTLEFINNKTGTLVGSLTQIYSSYAPQPIPYNFACRFFDGSNDYIVIPDNGAFDQTAAGSMEAWIYLNATGQLNTIFQKGTSFATTTLAFYIFAGNKIGINIGAHNYISTGPTTFVANRWYHVAATWTGGPNFTVKLYVNGVLDYTSTFNLAMPTNADPAWIGRYYNTTGQFNGYIDEVRLWNNALTADQIKANMFASGRTLMPNANLLGVWNFDGNLLNRGTTTGINGSFSTGGTNNCRLSAFRNETSSGALSTSFIAHATVVNRLYNTGPYPFPQGFAISIPNKPINDLLTTNDVITINGSGALTSINVFVAIRHTYCADLDIVLRAPNNQTRNLTSDNGGTGEDILTFFVDGSQAVTTANFYPPWSNVVGPEATMGNFGGTNIHGNWRLEVYDDLAGNTGTLIGWGIRFNNGITGSDPVTTNIPDVYRLHQNYPNPFNPVTNIKFDLPKSSIVKLVVYDILGREVKTLVNELRNAGSYELNFDASNFASGTYIYRIEAGDFVDVKKMILIK